MAYTAHIIIVTHNSERVISRCLTHLERQTNPPTSCIVVDSGSTDPEYLKRAAAQYSLPLELVTVANKGFSTANNSGCRRLALNEDDLVIFCNPDCFLSEDWIERAGDFLRDNPAAGMVSGKLLGFDLSSARPSGRLDSTGIFRAWYGRWYDRGQGEVDSHRYEKTEEVPALCGALLACRGSCIMELGDTVFDEDFFLYKEDIELSLRIRKNGWQLYYTPPLSAFHCRGWDSKRSEIDYRTRLMAAASEILLYKKHMSPYMVWALAKYGAVRLFRL